MTIHKNLVSVLLVATILLFLLPRFNGLFTHDFPAMDGGLFNTLVTDIEQANFRLPKYTSYNNDNIPFAYPPLGFYFLALLHTVTAVELTWLQRLVPLVITLLNVFIFYRFTRTLFSHRNHALIITLCFTAIPNTYLWMLVGGGISRAVGFFFALTALWLQRRTFQTGTWFYRIGTVLGIAGTFSSHPEWTVYLITSLLFFASVGKNRYAQVKETFLAMLLATLLISPWWLTVIKFHGITPLIAPRSAIVYGNNWKNVDFPSLFHLDPGDPQLIAGALGLLFSLMGKRQFIAVWFLILTFTNLRAALAYTNIPLAFAAGYAWIRGLDFAGKQKTKILMYIVVILAFCQTFKSNSQINIYRVYFLSPIDRIAFLWVKQNTPADARFLVLNDLTGEAWSTDTLREWFPTLTQRTSITTAQGYEWKGNEFKERIAWNTALADCTAQARDCLDQWSSSAHRSYTHIYLQAVNQPSGLPCCTALINSLTTSPHYEKIYDKDHRIIWQVKRPLPTVTD